MRLLSRPRQEAHLFEVQGAKVDDAKERLQKSLQSRLQHNLLGFQCVLDMSDAGTEAPYGSFEAAHDMTLPTPEALQAENCG